MKCWVPCHQCSYEEIAKVNCDEIVKDPNDADYCIDDVVMFMKRYPVVIPKCKLWGDTMAYPIYYRHYTYYPGFYTPSQWVYDYFKRVGFNILGVKKYKIAHFEFGKSKDILFLFVGVSRFFDRKNVSLVQELGIRNKTLIVSLPNPPLGVRNGMLTKVPVVMPDVNAFTLSIKDLHELYARAKFILAFSVSEGVGLPPIEAMAYGTVPIFVNGHGYHENLVGIPVDIKDEYTLEVQGYYFRIWEPLLQDIRYAVHEAMTMSESEYINLSAKVREKALNMHNYKLFLGEKKLEQ